MCLLFPNFYVFHWWILNKEINDWLDLLFTESQGLRNRLIRVRVQGKETPQYSGADKSFLARVLSKGGEQQRHFGRCLVIFCGTTGDIRLRSCSSVLNMQMYKYKTCDIK